MLKQRILTAILLAPVVLAIIAYGNDLIFSLFISLLALLISFEWCQIVRVNKVNSAIISVVTAIAIFAISHASLVSIDLSRILLASAVLWLICLFWLFKPEQGKEKFTVKYALGVGILLLFGASIIAIHRLPAHGVELTLVLFLLVWVADIGAYVTGVSMGKHKLAKKVSPGKTIEGLFGGLLFSAIFGYFVAQWLGQDWRYFVIAFPLIAGISVIGDLFASLLKRQASVKDSGFLLPGHGGFLDRFDSLIACTPFYFAFVGYIYAV